MKTLIRRLLIALAVPAGVILALNQLGGTPLSKGSDTGFATVVETIPEPRAVMSNDSGDLSCWIRLRVPTSALPFTATLSSGGRLKVYQQANDGSNQLIGIVADGPQAQTKFNWPSGDNLILKNGDRNVASVQVADWQVFLTDKGYDSRTRASWRRVLFYLSLVALLFALAGGGFEAWSKMQETAAVFTARNCIEELIKATEGSSRKETKRMKSILTKVLLEGVSPSNALKTLPLNPIDRWSLWFSARNQFRERLEQLIVDLNQASSRVQPGPGTR